MAPHVQLLGNLPEVKFIDEQTQEQFIQYLSKGSRDLAIQEAARQQVLGWKTEFEARLAKGPYPVLGETPEETNRPAYQTHKLSDGKHIIRFFPGGGRPGMLFFDFVRADTGARATPGYDVYQLSPHHPEKLMPLYDIIDPERRGPIATTPPRYALLEGVRIKVEVPGHPDQDIFTSPVIPLTARSPTGPQF